MRIACLTFKILLQPSSQIFFSSTRTDCRIFFGSIPNAPLKYNLRTLLARVSHLEWHKGLLSSFTSLLGNLSRLLLLNCPGKCSSTYSFYYQGYNISLGYYPRQVVFHCNWFAAWLGHKKILVPYFHQYIGACSEN